MPIIKSQEEKSEAHKKLQPQHNRSVIQLILGYDLCGWKQGRIAEEVGLTQSRVCIIMNSPLYKTQRDSRWAQLRDEIATKTSDKVSTGDPVEIKIKDLAIMAIDKKEKLLDAKNEFVQNSVASDILDRAGYGAKQKKITSTIEVTEKMASRFEAALQDNTSPTVRIKVETTE